MADPERATRRPLQPLGPRVPDSWLIGIAEPEARRLAEMTGDRDLLDRLMWAGYQGPEYERLADRLVRYGHAVIRAWCVKGLIFGRCAERGRAIQRASISRDDAGELAVETVAVALQKFRDTVLIPHRWDPTRGASLNSFFIGQCLLRFPNVYRRWHRETFQILPPSGELTVDPVSADPHVQPEHSGLLRRQIADAFTGIDDVTTRAIVVFKAAGYSNEEIAELCQLSLPAVKSRLYHLQQRKDQGDVA